jgi:NAD+ diphosphatase
MTSRERFCTQCGQPVTKETTSLLVCQSGHKSWINPPVGAAVYVLKDDCILFGVRSIEPHIGKLSMPGGFIELNETAEAAAVREVKEELGIDVTIRTYLSSYATMYGDRPMVDLVYIADFTGQAIVPGDDMNGGEPVWRRLNDLPSLDELAWDWNQESQADLLKWWHSQNLG